MTIVKRLTGAALIALCAAVQFIVAGPAFADDAPAAAASSADTAAPAAATSAESQASVAEAPSEWHHVRMHVAGSMCLACLHDLQGKISKLPGIQDVTIKRAPPNYFNTVAAEISNFADFVATVDEAKLPLTELRQTIRKNGYYTYQVVDKPLGHEPEKKIQK